MDKPQQRNESSEPRQEDLLTQLIDDLCDEFEARWRSGKQPRIEDFLEHVSEEHRRELLGHLLALEVHWRWRNAESPTPEEYTRRFPRDLETVEDAFAASPKHPSATKASAETILASEDAPTATSPANARRLGHYRIVEELGRGGMGIVYRVWQESADRYVALKLIRRDRLEALPPDRQASVIHRFEHEAQAAGRIEHDHIVPVYEVGQIEGEHFYSMRYVEGQSLNDLLKAGPLDGRKAAAYLEPVARAVHEAHLHGILHRDLKPQNILIDGKTDRALVVDFGLAKLAEGAEGMTEAGDVMGTPSYMSPEQAKDSSSVTAKSDVYGLGATLYHAVVGHPPFQSATVLETIRQVVDEAPVAPRQSDPRIDLDLDTICLKCLEKTPAQRYASAEALADELRRYLNHEPIEARPLGVAGRTVRWCRRYPLVASLLCCTLLFFVAALLAGAIGYVQTRAALAISEQNYQRARGTVDWFFTRVSEESLLDQPGLQPLRRELLEQALKYYEQFVKERADDPTARDELAANAYRLGRISRQLGSIDDAENWYRRAIAIQEELLAERPGDQSLTAALGDTLNAMGEIFLTRQDLEQARAFYQRAVRVRGRLALAAPGDSERERKLANSVMNLGVVARESQQEGEARSRFLEAQNHRYEILKRDPENVKTRRDLAMGCYNLANLYTSLVPMDAQRALENLEEALHLFETLLAAQPNDITCNYRTAVTARLYGDLLCHLGRLAEATPTYQRALDLMRHLAYLNPDVPDYRQQLAGVEMNLALTLDDRADTAACFDEARQILEDLTARYPDNPDYRRDLAATICAIGNLVAEKGETDAALQLVRQARVHFERLCRDYPERAEYARLLQKVKTQEASIKGDRRQDDDGTDNAP